MPQQTQSGAASGVPSIPSTKTTAVLVIETAKPGVTAQQIMAVANKEAQRHKTSKKELDNMRALIARDLADADIVGLSADRRFATAYNAALSIRSTA